jgi:hypothetical protein
MSHRTVTIKVTGAVSRRWKALSRSSATSAEAAPRNWRGRFNNRNGGRRIKSRRADGGGLGGPASGANSNSAQESLPTVFEWCLAQDLAGIIWAGIVLGEPVPEGGGATTDAASS